MPSKSLHERLLPNPRLTCGSGLRPQSCYCQYSFELPPFLRWLRTSGHRKAQRTKVTGDPPRGRSRACGASVLSDRLGVTLVRYLSGRLMQPGREVRKRMWQSGEVKGFDETLCEADL